MGMGYGALARCPPLLSKKVSLLPTDAMSDEPRTGVTSFRRCRSAASRCTRASRSSRCAPHASHARARFPEVLGGQLTLRRLNQMRMHVLAFMKW